MINKSKRIVKISIIYYLDFVFFLLIYQII